MFGKQAFATGLAAAVVFVGFALAPANADNKEAVAMQSGTIAMEPLNSPETPQDQVWDMTYGNLRMAAVDADTLDADETIVDYTFG